MSPTQAKVPETKKTTPSTRSGGKQPKPEIANPTPPTERKPWFDPSRIGWDLAAVLFLALVFGPQAWIKSVMQKHGEQRSDFPGTGGELARHLLDKADLGDV